MSQLSRAGGTLAITIAVMTGAAGVRAQEGPPGTTPAKEDEPFDQPSIAPILGQRPDGARAKLASAGIRWRAIYTGDFLSNVSGGISRGATYGGRLELGLQADLEKFGWAGALFNVSAFAIHGRGMTADHLGNLLAVSNIEALPTVRLFELWLDQKIGTFGSLRVGQLAADSEFITSENAGLFINGTFGWPGITGANLPSGGSAYPLATPGARLEINLGIDTKLRAAIFNGDPAGPGAADPQRRNRHGVNFRINDDPFLITELEHAYKLGASGLPGTIKLGIWYHTGTFADQFTGVPLRGSWGPYAVIEQTLVRLRGKEERSVGAFARISASPDDRSLIDFYADAGVTVAGVFAARPDDQFGIAFGYAKISERARQADRDLGLLFPGYPIRDYEAVLEVTYKTEIVPGWTVQPDIQYIFHPGGKVPHPDDPIMTRPVGNAVVIGVRSTVQY